jgi:hypothetical protein
MLDFGKYYQKGGHQSSIVNATVCSLGIRTVATFISRKGAKERKAAKII